MFWITILWVLHDVEFLPGLAFLLIKYSQFLNILLQLTNYESSTYLGFYWIK